MLIRHLKVDDMVTITILGELPTGEKAHQNNARSVLMIQTTKSDLDAFAGGELSNEEFNANALVSIL